MNFDQIRTKIILSGYKLFVELTFQRNSQQFAVVMGIYDLLDNVWVEHTRDVAGEVKIKVGQALPLIAEDWGIPTPAEIAKIRMEHKI